MRARYRARYTVLYLLEVAHGRKLEGGGEVSLDLRV